LRRSWRRYLAVTEGAPHVIVNGRVKRLFGSFAIVSIGEKSRKATNIFGFASKFLDHFVQSSRRYTARAVPRIIKRQQAIATIVRTPEQPVLKGATVKQVMP